MEFPGASLLWPVAFLALTGLAHGGEPPRYAEDVFQTDQGPLTITCIGHGTLMLTWQDLVIHVDPVTREADYTDMPKADLILITHEHGDHLDPQAIAQITKDGTRIVINEAGARKLGKGEVMKNGDVREVLGITLAAVPAYNLEKAFHPKGRDNGYVLTFPGLRVYVAGDTENISEMKDLTDIDVAFLPMNLPYTMTPEMVADAALAFEPEILYPYHFGETDPQRLVDLLRDHPEIEVRVRQMQ